MRAVPGVILRGRYPHRTGVVGNLGLRGFLDNGGEDNNIAVWLHAAGYSTALIGKYMNGYNPSRTRPELVYVPPGWDYWFAVRRRERGYDYPANDNGTWVEYEDERATT